MAILQPGNLVYYHPLDDLVDSAGVTWGGSPVSAWSGTVDFVPGKVADSAALTSGPIGAIGDGTVGGYGNMDGATRWTQAWWMNFPDLVLERGVIGGFVTGPGFAVSGSPAQTLQVRENGQIRFFLGSETGGGGTASIETIPIVATATGWHLYVVDAERVGSTWVFRHSVDGVPFTEESALAGAGPLTGGPTEAIIAVFDGAKGDEFAIWKDADLFTTQELANLFDLADTFGEPMDQYSENFVAPICWQATAMVNGRPWSDSGPGQCPPVVRVPAGARDIVVTDDGHPISPRIVEG